MRPDPTRPGPAGLFVFLLCPGAPEAVQPGWEIRIPSRCIAETLSHRRLGFVWGHFEFGTLCVYVDGAITTGVLSFCCVILVPFSVAPSRTGLGMVSAGGFFGRKEESHNKLELVMSALSSSADGGLADASFRCSPARPRHHFSRCTYAIHKHCQI